MSVSLLMSYIWSHPNTDYDMCNCKAEKLYLNNFENPTEPKRKSSLPGQDYFYNSYGFRSPEFSPENELLTLGCSFTEGYGIDKDEHIWAHQLADMLGVKYSNLAQGGESVGAQVRKAFAYFKKFGHPKYVVALLPDLYRFEYPYNEKLLVTHKEKYKDRELRYVRSSNFVGDYEKVSTISRLPHRVNDVINEEVRNFYSIQQLWMLEQYCVSNGIKFVWSFWSPEHTDLMYKLKTIDPSCVENFVDVGARNWWYDEKTGEDNFYPEQRQLPKERVICHKEYEDLEYFHLGKDRPSPHPGMHRHIHWAEAFYKKIKG